MTVGTLEYMVRCEKLKNGKDINDFVTLDVKENAGKDSDFIVMKAKPHFVGKFDEK